jgi:5'-deoxynucleotidase YfbR-like HD superfamily hydrolase
MRIYWEIFGPLPPEVSSYILWHDLGEIYTGDIPFPIKRENPVLKAEMDRLEAEAISRMDGQAPHALVELSDRAKWRVKLCDVVEMLEFGFEELAKGNSYAEPIIEGTSRAIESLEAALGDLSHIDAYLTRLPWSGTKVAFPRLTQFTQRRRGLRCGP